MNKKDRDSPREFYFEPGERENQGGKIAPVKNFVGRRKN